MRTFNSILFILFISIINFEFGFGQEVFYQDVYRGGITFAGSSTADASGEITLPIFIEPASNIRKIFLVTISQNKSQETIDDILININGQNFIQDFTSNFLVSANWPINPANVSSHSIHISDITNQFVLTSNSISISIPLQANAPFGCPSCRYSAPGLLILYDNPLLSPICVVLSANNKSQDSEINFNYSDFCAPNLSDDVAFSLHSDRLGANLTDGYNIQVNGNAIGTLNLEDASSLFSGTVGNFYYQNGQTYGLTDDTANPFMSGADALANINNYLVNLDNLSIDVDYIIPTTSYHNNVVGLYFAYSTPCEPFDVSVSSDTSVCKSSMLQLNASGGQSYEWQPSAGLSCTNCPNPILTADSSMFYTVRIWNNDSCSVVRPVKINVRPKPSFGALTLTPSQCGASSASATLFALNGNGTVANWQEVGGANQTSNVFQNLSAGFHTFNFIDTNGCQSADTTIFIGEINSTVASFTANPQSGAVPLEVNFTNTSVSATSYNWFVDGNLVSNIANLQNWQFGISGNYEVMLVAWQFDPSCADTFALNIIVYDSLIVQIPNVFTPNGDGINDFFGITSSLVVDAEVLILNRWGNEVFSRNVTLQQGFNEIWLGSNVNDGTYFYKVVLSQNVDVPIVKGLEDGLEKTGFVEVRH